MPLITQTKANIIRRVYIFIDMIFDYKHSLDIQMYVIILGLRVLIIIKKDTN